MTPQQLKNSILQLAIQGKLVDQIASEGSADELYVNIQKEKNRLISEKKMKIFKSLSSISDDEIPFDIPETWKWVRLGSLCTTVTKGTTPRGGNVAYLDSGIGFLRAENVAGMDHLNLGPLKYISQTVHEGDLARSILEENDILITIAGTLGRTALVRKVDLPLNANQAVAVVRLISTQLCNLYYLIYALNAPLIQKELLGQKKITAIPNLTLEIIRDCMIPLPPLDEQMRIVDKIEQLLPLVDRYGEAWSRLEAFNQKFPEDMKKSILQQAIQGKLVEQRAEEGTAEELYNQILAEKQELIAEKIIKKEKALAAIVVDEIPFDIPDSWKLSRFGEVCTLVSGVDFPPSGYNSQGKGIPYITGASCLSDTGVIENRWTECPRNFAYRGDVLLVCKGSGYGKTVICDVEQAQIARQIMAIRNSKLLDMEYVMLFLKSQIDYIKKQGQGVIPGIDRSSILNMVFPLPPLKEQKRIVKKVEQLVVLVDTLIK